MGSHVSDEVCGDISGIRAVGALMCLGGSAEADPLCVPSSPSSGSTHVQPNLWGTWPAYSTISKHKLSHTSCKNITHFLTQALQIIYQTIGHKFQGIQFKVDQTFVNDYKLQLEPRPSVSSQ